MDSRISVANLTVTPAQVLRMQTITASVDATNNSLASVTTQIKLGGWWVLAKTVSFAAGETKAVALCFKPSTSCALGVHPVRIEGLTGYVEVVAQLPDPADPGPEPDPVEPDPGTGPDATDPGTTDGGGTGPASPGDTPDAGDAADSQDPDIQTGLLLAGTSPVGAPIFIDGAMAGQTQSDNDLALQMATGEYTVSFGDVPGYITPAPQSVTLAADQELHVLGYYQRNSVRVSLPWLIAGAAVVAMLLPDDRRGR